MGTLPPVIMDGIVVVLTIKKIRKRTNRWISLSAVSPSSRNITQQCVWMYNHPKMYTRCMYRVSAGKMRVRVKMRGENEKQYGDDGGGGGDDDDGGGGSAITNAMVVTRVRDDEKLEEETLISTSTTTTTTRRKDMRYNLWTHSVAFMILFSGMTTFFFPYHPHPRTHTNSHRPQTAFQTASEYSQPILLELG